MPFSGFGPWEMIFVLLIVLLVFGAKRLPEIGSSLGKGIREFKRSVTDIQSEINRPDDKREIRPPADPPRAAVSGEARPAERAAPEPRPAEETRERT